MESIKKYIIEIAKKNPLQVIKIMIMIGAILLSWFSSAAIVQEMIDSVREIRENTKLLANNLKDSTNGGITVVIGVNPVEIKENLAFVYDDNELNLKPGDVIVLKNHTDNTFQPSLNFIIQKSLPESTLQSRASIFIGLSAAKKLGFDNYRKQGTIALKMRRVTDKESL